MEETIVELLTENCARVEARATINPKQFQKVNLKKEYSIAFEPESDRRVCLFSIAECSTTIFDLLRNPASLAGFRIRNKTLWLREKTQYDVNSEGLGMRITIRKPKIDNK